MSASRITTPMLVANFCLAWSAFPVITNTVKGRVPGWSPVLTYRFCKMWQYGAELNLLDSRFASVAGTSGENVTIQNVRSMTDQLQNFLQSVSMENNLNMVMQTTVGIADAGYSALPMAVASKFEVMGWVILGKKAFDGATAANKFRKAMKNNPRTALDSYEELLLMAHGI